MKDDKTVESKVVKHDNFIHIEFKADNKTEYNLQVKSHNEVIAAIMGLEAYACKLLMLDISSVRELIDEMKVGFQVQPPKPLKKDA